ncbi:MAG TPA: hypothetical protein VFJ16_02955 [Longimicrobium sp.]|nr:hypothetical protein [Longimicrobium sp.]
MRKTAPLRSSVFQAFLTRPLAAAAMVLGLARCAPAPAVSPVPQPGTLAQALRNSGMQPDSGDLRLGRERFPLLFAVNLPYGAFRSPGRTLHMAVHGHGRTAIEHRSISFELLFWQDSVLEADLDIAQRVMAAAGLPAGVPEAAGGIIREARARWQASGRATYMWAPTNQARDVAGFQVRVEGRSPHYFIVQVTDARAPETRWPSPGEVEALQPHTRRPFFDARSDVPGVIEPEVTQLRCRNAKREAFLCSYVVRGKAGGGPLDRYTDLFSRGADGRWTIELRSSDQPSRKWVSWSEPSRGNPPGDRGT